MRMWWWVLSGLFACGAPTMQAAPDEAGPVARDGGDAGPSGGCTACDGGQKDAGRAVDAGLPSGGGGFTARPDAGPTLCDVDAGVRVRLDPSTIDGGFSACPPAGQRPAGDCVVYCACWFRNCAERPAYGCVHPGWQACLDACATFSAPELSCRLYRVNNNPLERHCAEARPRNACP